MAFAGETERWGDFEVEEGEMVLNMGPQHPSTHGVLRLALVTDGEIVKRATPHIGYLHRCFEKHAEAVDYPGVIPYADRIDYLAAMNQELAYALAVEKLMGIQVPERVEYIRVIMAELNRIASHLVAIGTYGLDIGVVTPFLWCFRDRERILDLLEWLSGARLLYNYLPGTVSVEIMIFPARARATASGVRSELLCRRPCAAGRAGGKFGAVVEGG